MSVQDLVNQLSEEQSIHHSKFMELAGDGEEHWILLEGGPGTGKTFLTSALKLSLMEHGYELLAIYPTHAARLVAIENLESSAKLAGQRLRLIDFQPETYTDSWGNEKFKPGCQDEKCIDAVYAFGGGKVIFKTSAAALRVFPMGSPGKQTEKFVQQFKEVAQAQTNVFFDYIFVDEVSMIPEDQFMADTQTEAIKQGLSTLIENLQYKFPDPEDKNRSKFRPVVHLSGDFNQLPPPGGESFESCLRGCALSLSTTLTENHRAEVPGLVKLVEDVLKLGKLPKNLSSYPSVHVIKDNQKYQKKFSQYVKQHGGNVLGLAWTNADRKKYSDIAAEAKGESDQFFVENILTLAEGKAQEVFPPPADGPKLEVFFYNGEEVVIKETSHLETILNTTFLPEEYQVTGVKAVLHRKLTDEIYHRASFYLYDFVGSSPKKCQRKKYLNRVEVLLSKMVDAVSTPKKQKDIQEILTGALFKIPAVKEILRDIDPQLEDMFNFYCYTLDKVSVIERYLYDLEFEHLNEIVRFFGDSPAGTKSSLRNLLWVNFSTNVKFQALPTRTINAYTCHSAQGAGRDFVFLDVKSLLKCQKPEVFKSLLYVGVSRAKKELTILI